jgi:hypothetical protein
VTRAKISEYSATAGDNTDVNGVNIAEGCPPSSMNNMGREIMAALKRFQVGSDGDGVTVGGALVVSNATTLTTVSATVVQSDTVSEKTSAAGVTVDGVLLKDSQVTTDQINEKTSAAGVTVDGVLLKDTGVGSAASPVTLNSLAYPTEGSVNFRNRIINGDMRIDQRNAGAAVTINTTSNIYTVDRWFASGQATDGVFTVDQVTDAPTGFVNSTKITVTTADASIGSTQFYLFSQFIEGNNVADLGFGAANAKTITVSFWVRSSLTGTFGGALNNSANDRNYPFTYSISAANTWEYKTITIAGDTSGTWLTTTGRGIGLRFQIGAGSSAVATAGSWTGTSSIFGATGATNIISTLNADWYITGVQLEVGSVATPFERRPFGTELQLCQRYYQQITRDGAYVGAGQATTANNVKGPSFSLMQTMRTAPTITLPSVGSSSGNISYLISNDTFPGTFGTISTNNITTQWFSLTGSGFATFTAGNASNLYFTGSSTITISAEL